MTLFESIYRFFGWWIINVDLFLLVFLFLGSGFLLIQRKKWGKRFLFISCFGFAFLSIVPIGVGIFEALEDRFPPLHHIPANTKGIILLGGNFNPQITLWRGETAYNLNAGYFIRFVELAKEYPHLQLVFTGTPFEVETAKKEFKALGLDSSAILFEGESKDTKDNASKTSAYLNPKPGEVWVLLTSAYHMPRSVGLFRKAGVEVIPYPSDYHTPPYYALWIFPGLKLNLDAWQVVSREWLGMLINYLMGRSDELYPSPIISPTRINETP